MDGMRFRSLCANMDRLSVEQIRELRRKLRALDARREVLARIDARGQALECCIHCGASALVRWGSTRTGLQRLCCKACGRTFSAASGTVVARVRLPEKLQQVLADMLAPVPSSCRGLAARLGIDKMTVWRWRAGILKALDGIGAQRLGGIVEADETYMRESRKGSREWVNHARDPQHFPAPPRPRWRDFRQLGLLRPAGLSKWQIPILTLADRAGARRAERLPDRRAESLVAVLEARISRDAVLCSDRDGAYDLFARARGLPHYRLDAARGPRVIQAAFHIQTVNNMHSRFKAFMGPFCGPATKYLPAYLAWFIARLADEPTAQNEAWQKILAA
ncbi:MAG: IS1595 family transposase [Limibaculum sp.]